MKWSELTIARLACACFFICPGITYGVLTSRLPALKAQTGANDGQIGMFLLSLGGASLVALFSSSWLISQWNSRVVLKTGTALLLVSTILAGVCHAPLQLTGVFIVYGLGTGLVDVSMNVQGLLVERRYKEPSMSLMHAFFSLGVILGALSGSLFAALEIPYLLNALCALGIYACCLPWASRRLLVEVPMGSDCHREGRKNSSGVPFFVILCGLVSMMAYAAEGPVAEWGSLFLHSVKNAPEETAALVYAVFSAAALISRLSGDRLRKQFGDYSLALGGAMMAACGMACALFSLHSVACLAGYTMMGVGLAPLVPMLFSRAGRCRGVSASKASAIVSVLSYSGMLFFPPLLGLLANERGLENALLVVLCLCGLLCVGSFIFWRPRRRRRSVK